MSAAKHDVRNSAHSTPTGLRCEYFDNPIGVDEPAPRLSWLVMDDRRGARQSAYQVLVTGSTDELADGTGELWDSGKIPSDQSVHVAYAGAALGSRQRCFWKVRTWDAEGLPSPWSEPATWQMGLLNPRDWTAKWIGPPHQSPASGPRPCPHLRKDFTIGDPVDMARAYVTGQGLYILYLNGQRVGDDLFTPGWTDYHKRIQYQSYDVTELLRSGANTLGIILGDGWAHGRLGFRQQRSLWGHVQSLLLQLEITFADGRVETTVSDPSWRISTGPILASDLYDGETYDARLEMPGWKRPGFDDGGWSAAVGVSAPAGTMVAQRGPTVKKIQKIKPLAITEPRLGAYVFDLGQNMVGWARLKLKGAAGTTITIRHAEILQADGTLYTANLRTAKCTNQYILKGRGEEIYEPYFTFQGFRYIEVDGLTQTPTPDTLTGIVIHSDIKPVGSFECSDPLVNQLQSNITWGQKGNFLEVPTDCPQRDERLGWTGDAQVFCRTACFNMDVASFFTKWLDDLPDAQREDGAFTDVAPNVIPGAGGTPVWADAGIICPWTIYLCYGDKRILERHYDAMAKYITYLQANSTDLIRPAIGYGDWVAMDPNTPKDLIATAFFTYVAQLMAKIAAVLGKQADRDKYHDLAQRIRQAFINQFITPSGRVLGETQTSYILVLMFDLLPAPLRAMIVDRLVKDIRGRNNHLSTGFVGATYINHALTAVGRNDVAYDLLQRDTFPSWLYPVRQGATTIWERWDGYRDDVGIYDPAMNSFNHYAYGSIGTWMYQNVAGIDLDPDRPGYKHIIIRPRPGGDLTYARADYQSIHGRIASHWRLDGAELTLDLVIPPNTTATVYVPTDDPQSVTESGKPAAQAEEVSSVGSEAGAAVFSTGAGIYQFKAHYPRRACAN